MQDTLKNTSEKKTEAETTGLPKNESSLGVCICMPLRIILINIDGTLNYIITYPNSKFLLQIDGPHTHTQTNQAENG